MCFVFFFGTTGLGCVFLLQNYCTFYCFTITYILLLQLALIGDAVRHYCCVWTGVFFVEKVLLIFYVPRLHRSGRSVRPCLHARKLPAPSRTRLMVAAAVLRGHLFGSGS